MPQSYPTLNVYKFSSVWHERSVTTLPSLSSLHWLHTFFHTFFPYISSSLIMRPTSRCWLGFFSVMALTISQTSALFVPNAADAVGAKNDHWRRGPDSLVLAQPNLVIVQRDCSPELQSAAGQPIARDVWDPRITHPSASTVWERGSAVTVTW